MHEKDDKLALPCSFHTHTHASCCSKHCTLLCVHWMCIFVWLASGAQNKCEDPIEYVLKEKELYPSEEASDKMTMTLISFLILLCLDVSFPLLFIAAYHVNI